MYNLVGAYMSIRWKKGEFDRPPKFENYFWLNFGLKKLCLLTAKNCS